MSYHRCFLFFYVLYSARFLGCSNRLNALEPMSILLERVCGFGVHVRASESLKSLDSFLLEPLGSRPIVGAATWETLS